MIFWNRGTVVSNIELQSAGDESLNLAVWTMLSKKNSVHHVSLVGASEHSWIMTFQLTFTSSFFRGVCSTTNQIYIYIYIRMENHHFLMGKSTISMAIFNQFLFKFGRLCLGQSLEQGRSQVGGPLGLPGDFGRLCWGCSNLNKMHKSWQLGNYGGETLFRPFLFGAPTIKGVFFLHFFRYEWSYGDVLRRPNPSERAKAVRTSPLVSWGNPEITVFSGYWILTN